MNTYLKTRLTTEKHVLCVYHVCLCRCTLYIRGIWGFMVTDIHSCQLCNNFYSLKLPAACSALNIGYVYTYSYFVVRFFIHYIIIDYRYRSSCVTCIYSNFFLQSRIINSISWYYHFFQI